MQQPSLKSTKRRNMGQTGIPSLGPVMKIPSCNNPVGSGPLNKNTKEDCRIISTGSVGSGNRFWHLIKGATGGPVIKGGLNSGRRKFVKGRKQGDP